MEVSDIETVLRENIPAEEVHGFIDYMANLIKEEPPNVSHDLNFQNELDLYKLIGDFLTDAMVYSKEDGLEICKTLNEM